VINVNSLLETHFSERKGSVEISGARERTHNPSIRCLVEKIGVPIRLAASAEGSKHQIN
jgi:hypothetical protein